MKQPPSQKNPHAARERSLSLRPCAALLALLCMTARAELNPESPFLPPATAAAAAADSAVLEFRGVTVIAGETYFNLSDPATRKGTWVKLNQPGSPIQVKSYEVANGADNIAVDFKGRSLHLPLMKPKAAKASLPSAAQMAAAARPGPPPPGMQPAPQQNQGPISPVVLNPTPADEARRLEDFRAEYQRRRAQRQQATQQQQQQTPQQQQRRR